MTSLGANQRSYPGGGSNFGVAAIDPHRVKNPPPNRIKLSGDGLDDCSWLWERASEAA